jgi:hypothetical protein
MIHIYHPSKSVKGFACSFWASRQYKGLFATLIKQSGWDEKNQNGTFKDNLNDPTKTVNIKLSDFEACAILDCVDRNRPFSTFHQNDELPKSISFTPWIFQPPADDEGIKPPAIQKGFSFTVVIGNKTDTNKNSFYIGLTYAEARLVREYIIYYLQNSFRNPQKTNRTSEEPEVEVNNTEIQPSNSLVDI